MGSTMGELYESMVCNGSNLEKWEVKTPVFVIGCPRSGTQLLYNLLTAHKEFAYLTFATCREPSRLLWANKMAVTFRLKNRLLPMEGNAIWERHLPGTEGHKTLPVNHFVTEGDLTYEARKDFKTIIKKQCYWFQRHRFLNKCPFHSVRVRYLHALFPDAIFLHIIRDARAVTRSILEKRRFWFGNSNTFWNVKPRKWRDLLERDPIESAALQWQRLIKDIRDQAEYLGLDESRYGEVLYSDLVDQPERTLRKIFQTVDLCFDGWDKEKGPKVRTGLNEKWKAEFSQREVKIIEEIMADSDWHNLKNPI